jgi:hypothetical protein
MTPREQLEARFRSLGFEPRKDGRIVRRQGTVTDEAHILWSGPDESPPWARLTSLSVKDRAIGRGWSAGGPLDRPHFDVTPKQWNLGTAKAVATFEKHVTSALSFFTLAANAERLLELVSTRYVGGFVAPSVVVPYLHARLGQEAVATYAAGLLGGRNELWPAFLGKPALKPGYVADHGTQLAIAIAEVAPREKSSLTAPRDAVKSRDLSSANLRSFVGLQLRAWGVPNAAQRLRTLDDGAVKALFAAQNEIGEDVDNQSTARLALRAVRGRGTLRARPTPRFFQYEIQHPPFSER